MRSLEPSSDPYQPADASMAARRSNQSSSWARRAGSAAASSRRSWWAWSRTMCGLLVRSHACGSRRRQTWAIVLLPASRRSKASGPRRSRAGGRGRIDSIGDLPGWSGCRASPRRDPSLRRGSRPAGEHPVNGPIRRSGVDGDRELHGEAVLDRARDRAQLVRPLVVGKDHVGREADLAERPDAGLVAGGPVDGPAGVRRQRDLRGGDPVRLGGRAVEARIDLEVDVRPAALVARREDALELDDPVVRRPPARRAGSSPPRRPGSTASTGRPGRSARRRPRRRRTARRPSRGRGSRTGSSAARRSPRSSWCRSWTGCPGGPRPTARGRPGRSSRRPGTGRRSPRG